MKQITFSKAKDNHFYAERINGELLQVKEPIAGKKYIEIPVISGGSTDYKPILLELPLPLCQKHIDKNPKEFIVKLCSGWSYKAIPVVSLSCKMCLGSILSPLAYLSKADLSEANLSEANLYGADLYEADLSKANLSKANLYGADLSGANLSEANLSKANLSEANLYEANLYEANLSKANLSGADLSGANLSGARYDTFTQSMNRLTKEQKASMIQI